MPKLLERLKQPQLMQKEELFYEATFQQLAEVRKQAFPARLHVGDLWSQRAQEAESQNLIFNGMMLSNLEKEVTKEAQSLANLRLALTAVALEKFRLANANRYPNSLDQLVPTCLENVPSDPFDGQPLRYRIKKDGYLLYSVGQDLKDDDGVRLTAKNGDLVFAVGATQRVVTKKR